MASQGPNYPSVGESITSGDANEVAWTTPANIQDADADEAQCIAATFDSPDPTEFLHGRGFGFTIPAGATVDGIVVEINRRSIIASSGKDKTVRLRDQFGTPVGVNKAVPATIWPTSLTIATYGGTTDLWDLNFVYTNDEIITMLNHASTGLVLQANANIANADIGASFIRMTVHYTEGAAGPDINPFLGGGYYPEGG